MATSHLRRSVKRYARKAGIEEVERVSPHTLRHTFATQLYRETSNIRMVQEALGHSDLSTTMIYTPRRRRGTGGGHERPVDGEEVSRAQCRDFSQVSGRVTSIHTGVHVTGTQTCFHHAFVRQTLPQDKLFLIFAALASMWGMCAG